MIPTVFLAVRCHAELQLGIGNLRPPAGFATVEGLAIIKFVFIEFPFPRHGVHGARLPAKRRDTRPQQIVPESQQQEAEVDGIEDHPENQKATAEERQPPHLHRDDQEHHKLMPREQGGEGEKRRGIDEEATPRHRFSVEEIREDQPDERGVMEQAGAEHPPRTFQRVVHHERDHHHEKQEQRAERSQPARAAIGDKEGEDPPHLAVHDLCAVEIQDLADAGIHDLQEINQHVKQRVIFQQPGERQPPEFPLPLVQKKHRGKPSPAAPG